MGARGSALAALVLLLTMSHGLASRALVDDLEGAETSGSVTLRSLKSNKNKINFKKSGCPDAWGAFRAINALRASRGAAPLKWSARLSLEAQGWANACTFSHSGGGENLMMGLGSCQGAVDWWAGEAIYWAPGMDYTPAAGHFTQLVWKGTTAVGCGYANCPGQPYVVCRFDPPGNVIGQFAWNVQ